MRRPGEKLTADLKRMLAGLACEDAGDYLSLDEKLRQIGQPEQGDTPRAANTDVRRTHPRCPGASR